MEYLFEWKDSNGNNKRMSVLTSDYAYAWHKALQECGWENRTSLGLVGDDPKNQIRNGIIVSWFQVMKDMYHDKRLKNFQLSLEWNLHDRLKSGFYKIVAI